MLFANSNRSQQSFDGAYQEKRRFGMLAGRLNQEIGNGGVNCDGAHARPYSNNHHDV